MKLTVEQVLDRHNVERNRAGYIRCPAHDDHSPSCKVSEDFVYCFTCGWNADAAGLEAQLTGRSVGAVLQDWDDGNGPRPTIKKKSARSLKSERWIKFVVDSQEEISKTIVHIDGWRMPREDQIEFWMLAVDQIGEDLNRMSKGRNDEEISPYQYDKLADAAMDNIRAWGRRWRREL